MKSILKLLLAVSLVTNGAIAQELNLDFKTKQYDPNRLQLDSLKPGGIYKVRVNNINLNVYQVFVSKSDTMIATRIDMQDLLILDFGSFASLLSNLVNNSNSLSYPEAVQEIQEQEQGFLPQKEFQAPIAYGDTQKEALTSFLKLADTFQRDMMTSVKFLKSVEQQLSQVVSQQNYNIRKRLSDCSGAITCDFSEGFSASFDNLRNDVYMQQFQVLDAIENYNHKRLRHLEKGDKAINTWDSLLIRQANSLLETFDSALSAMSVDSVSKYLDRTNQLIANRDTTYESLPFQYTKDQSTIYINIVPKDSSVGLPSYSTSYTFPRFQRRYWGIGGGFYYSGLSDETYSTIGQQISDTTNGYRLVQEEASNGEIGINMLLRAGKRFDKNGVFGAHVTVGTGLVLSDRPRPRILLGGGITVGQKHRLAVDLGIAGGQVYRLSNAFELGDTFIYSEQPTDVVVARLDWKLFASIGYVYAF